MTRSLLIAGIGNLFLGDDAFGCEVLRRLATRGAREGVTLRDFGVGVRALGYALAERGEEDTTILVDAVMTGAAPGTLQLFDLSVLPPPAAEPASAHAQDLNDALVTARALGARLSSLYLLGCEPASFEPASNNALTPVVEAAACRCVTWLGRLLEQPDADLVDLCAM